MVAKGCSWYSLISSLVTDFSLLEFLGLRFMSEVWDWESFGSEVLGVTRFKDTDHDLRTFNSDDSRLYVIPQIVSLVHTSDGDSKSPCICGILGIGFQGSWSRILPSYLKWDATIFAGLNSVQSLLISAYNTGTLSSLFESAWRTRDTLFDLIHFL